MNLREYLESKNISQSRAARELGQTRQHIGGIVNGNNLPGKKLIDKIIDWSGGIITAKDLRPDWAALMEGEEN